jgi:hypothetical protein
MYFLFLFFVNELTRNTKIKDYVTQFILFLKYCILAYNYRFSILMNKYEK